MFKIIEVHKHQQHQGPQQHLINIFLDGVKENIKARELKNVIHSYYFLGIDEQEKSYGIAHVSERTLDSFPTSFKNRKAYCGQSSCIEIDFIHITLPKRDDTQHLYKQFYSDLYQFIYEVATSKDANHVFLLTSLKQLDYIGTYGGWPLLEMHVEDDDRVMAIVPVSGQDYETYQQRSSAVGCYLQNEYHTNQDSCNETVNH